MIRLNVRCCCTPGKVLGTLQVPEDFLHRRGNVELHRSLIFQRDAVAVPSHPVKVKVDRVSLTLASYSPGIGLPCQLAIKSDERPLEFWRTVPGFSEGDQV